MSGGEVLLWADLFFRTYVHTALPLHMALVDEMCSAPRVPLELATVLEDIGQAYMRAADKLNAELIRRRELSQESEADETTEAQIERYVNESIARLQPLRLPGGRSVSARRAVESCPAVSEAMKVAFWMEQARTAEVPASRSRKEGAVTHTKPHRTVTGTALGTGKRPGEAACE